MRSALETACVDLGRALAAIGIDPRRVTVVVDPEDRWTLGTHALEALGQDVSEAINAPELAIGEITFLPWRRPAT